ncbi:MAG: TolC family protein [Proteobacteria bacterium]|nr:TolC family protein [Pseudomonadota bacterium]MBU4298276.1 TolC family protein [Pseudomonadota bacterium]MCG2747544.1 TolC family protein [Desulfobulbaceae bacterium]
MAAENDNDGTLSLEQCIEIVIANNPDLDMARSDQGNREALLQSSKKDLYPTLSAQYSYLHQPDELYTMPDLFTYGVKAEQPLYKGKSLVTAVKQAELSVETSKLVIDQVANNLVFDVYTRYFALLRALRLEEEARQSVLRLESHRKDAQAFYAAGLIPKNDMLQSEVELAQGEQDLVDAEKVTALAKAQLNVLMERPVDAFLNIEESDKYTIQDISWDEVIEKARQNRAEIAQSDKAVQIAKNDIVLKKAPYLPTITLSASYDRIGDDIGAAPVPGFPSEQKTVKAIATWKLWTWLKDRDEVHAAEKNLQKAKKAVTKSVNDVTLDARNSFLVLEQAAKRIKVSEKAIEHAKENYRINQAQYQAQLATSTDVLDAQSLLSQAMTNYYDALYGYQLALAAIDKSKGSFGQRYSK